nr:regulatory protein GemA [Rheinheimera maricola]
MPVDKQPFHNKKQLIQLLHIARANLNMDEHLYRQNLQAWCGKTSSKDMSVPELEKAMAGMKRLGFTPVPKAKDKSAKKPLQQDQLKKLGQVWTQMAAQGLINNAGYTALEQWAIEQSRHLNNGAAIQKLEWMADIAGPLIEQLKRWHRRLMLKQLGEPHSKASYNDVLRWYQQQFDCNEGA